MGLVLVEGATISITVDSPVTSPGVPAHVLTVSSSGKLTVDTKKASLKSDMESQSGVSGIAYFSTAFPIPGTLDWDGVLIGSAESGKFDKDGSDVTIDDNGGTVVWTVNTPAEIVNPSPPPATLEDMATSYPGSWSITDAGQSKLDTTE